MEDTQLSQEALLFAGLWAEAERITIEEWLARRTPPQDPALVTLGGRSLYPQGYEDKD